MIELYFGDIVVPNNKIRYCYDCLKILPEIQNCYQKKTQMMFHFLQPNHYGFDSLLYDGDAKLMVFIQITIDKSHSLPYETLMEFIEKKSTNKQHLKKYIDFFEKIEKDLASTFIFQWMTNKVYEEIENRTEKNQFNLSDSRTFKIYCYHKQLIKKIEETKMK